MRSSQRLLRRSAAWLHQCTSQAQSEGVLPICGGTCQAWRGQGASDAQAPSARQQLRQYAADAAAAAVAAPDGADASLLAPDANPDITKLKGNTLRSACGAPPSCRVPQGAERASSCVALGFPACRHPGPQPRGHRPCEPRPGRQHSRAALQRPARDYRAGQCTVALPLLQPHESTEPW